MKATMLILSDKTGEPTVANTIPEPELVNTLGCSEPWIRQLSVTQKNFMANWQCLLWRDCKING